MCVCVMFVDVRVVCILVLCSVANVMCVYLPAILTGDGKIPNIKFSTIKQMIPESSKLA